MASTDFEFLEKSCRSAKRLLCLDDDAAAVAEVWGDVRLVGWG